MNKKRLVIGIIGVATVLVIIGTTVAYFLTNPVGTNKEVLTINTGSLSLIFDDNSDGMQVKSLMLGESVSKEVKITNNGDLPVTTNLNWKDLTNTYLEKSLSYKIQYKTSEAGTWADIPAEHTNVPTSTSETEVTILKDITIPNEATYFYKITITLENTDEDQESDRNAMLATRFSLGNYYEKLTETQATLKRLGVEIKEGTPTFANPATTDEGVYAMEDDYGTSYYYRGAVTNNYVKFGGFYWRIIRINGDGSLRMIYDGTSYHSNGENNADRYTKISQPFNTRDDDAKYVGYMFGGSSKDAASTSARDAQTNTYDSDVKSVIDDWYEKNIKVNPANSNKDLTKYLADVIFCNDRTMPANGEIWWEDQDSYANLGWAQHNTPYGAFSRFLNPSGDYNEINPTPTFKCNDNMTTGNKNNDKFTVSDTKLGNGTLKYPIGLITADEIVAAGIGTTSGNNKFYLHKSTDYKTWTLSARPVSYSSAGIFYIDESGIRDNLGVIDDMGAVAPVINLKAKYAQQLVKSAETGNPYQIPGVQ